MTVWKYIIAALVLAASFEAAAASTYKVSANLLHNGISFASPSAIVKADTPASIEVSGPDSYKLSLTVTDVAPDKIKVSASLYSSHGAIAPVVVVRPGVSATVSVGELGLTLTVNRHGS